MTERIVYILGAGFSAPLGLPVMSEFLLRSKDLYFTDTERYAHFASVFKTIDRMAKAKNYYAVDLFNIEEILSLLEMEDYVGTSAHKDAYLTYLRDVVMAFTPLFVERPQEAAWQDFVVSETPGVSDYAAFTASVFGLKLVRSREAGQIFFATGRCKDTPTYGIITLNYDLILEHTASLLNSVLSPSPKLRFAPSIEELDRGGTVALAKLHGSVEPLTIIPPTWNKVANEEVKNAWRLAYRLLAEATQIRFMGYSLPISDTYVRYLLTSAVLESSHLKAIDSICQDNGGVKTRYKNLNTFYKFRFADCNIRRYLEALRKVAARSRRTDGAVASIEFDHLELIHSQAMENKLEV